MGAHWKRPLRFVVQLACVVCLVQAQTSGPIIPVPEEKLSLLRQPRRCTNLEEVQRDIGFLNTNKDPYPKLWYDTTIDYNKNCYVSFDSADRSTYRLENLAASESAESMRAQGKYLTHFGPCGVCSQFQDLVVYLTKPDLTNPVRACGLRPFKFQTINCLRTLGFSAECAAIWYFNIQNTRRIARSGGCFESCIIRVFSANNQPSGKYNPCKPTKEVMDAVRQREGGAEGVEGEGTLERVERALTDEATAQTKAIASGKGEVYADVDYSDGRCGNTINGKPACSEDQWQNGPGRLNPCLQCDECRSGPIFQKIAGRTRRGSGIVSAISRNGVKPLQHEYDL